MNSPQDKIEIIQHSVRCFHHAALGLLPIIGVPFFYFGLRLYFQVWKQVGTGWNPAGRHLLAGFIFSWLGAVSQVAGLVFVIHLLSALIDN